MDLAAIVDAAVPDSLADLLVRACEATGLRWGVVPRSQYFFQPPKLHIALFVVAMISCGVLWQCSRNYRKAAIARLAARGPGWSIRCPINTAVAFILMGCFAMQVLVKASRPKPFVQLGWLLMPCHLTTAAWIYILRRQKPTQYASNCYLATLLIDWLWSPLAALATPDWGDHQYRLEGPIFMMHHGLLVLLPIYYAARYHTEPLSAEHVMHLTWIPMLLNFALKTPVAMFLGLNVDYMLLPPPVKVMPPIFHSVYYRAVYIGVFVAMSCACNVLTRLVAKGIAGGFHRADDLKRKAT